MADIPNRTDLERKLARALAKILGIQEREISKLINADMFNNMALFMEPALASTQKEMEAILRTQLESVHFDAGDTLAGMTNIGVDWDLANEAAESWASRYAGELITGIEGTSKKRILGAVQRATSNYFGEGWTTGELIAAYEADPALAHLFTSEIRDKLGRVFGPTRAEMIAVTEITRAASEGERNAVAELGRMGADLIEIWETNRDDLVCVICRPRHRLPITDGVYPPAHPRCRCWVNHTLREPLPEPEIVQPAAPVQPLLPEPKPAPTSDAGQWVGNVVVDDKMTATARALPNGDIAVNSIKYGELKRPETREFVMAHEMGHHSIEDMILKDMALWDEAEDILSYQYNERLGRHLFAGGHSRIGESISDSFAVYLTGDKFGGISDTQMVSIKDFISRMIKKSPYTEDGLKLSLKRIYQDAENLIK